MKMLSRRGIHSRAILFAAASATLCITGDVFAQDLTLNLPPLNGFQPLVVFGLTDEQYQTDFSVDSFRRKARARPRAAMAFPRTRCPSVRRRSFSLRYSIPVLNPASSRSMLRHR